MDLEFKINEINQQVIEYASSFGKSKIELLECLTVEQALYVKPLLEQRITLLKQLWKVRNSSSNLILFSRTR